MEPTTPLLSKLSDRAPAWLSAAFIDGGPVPYEQTPGMRLLCSLVRYVVDGSPNAPVRCLPQHVVVEHARRCSVSIQSHWQLERWRCEAYEMIRDELHPFLDPGPLPDIGGETVMGVLHWAGPGGARLAPPAVGTLVEAVADYDMPDLVATLLDLLVALFGRPDDVLRIVRACLFRTLDHAEVERLAGDGMLDEAIVSKIGSPAMFRAVHAHVADVAAASPDDGVAAAMAFVVAKKGQGQVCKLGKLVLDAVTHQIIDRSLRQQPSVTGDVISPAAAVAVVAAASGEQDHPKVPALTVVHDAFRRLCDRSPSSDEKALLKSACAQVAADAGWSRDESSYVRRTVETLGAHDIAVIDVEVPVGGDGNRRFDLLLDVPDVGQVIGEVDGEHHTREMARYRRTLQECRDADVVKAVTHLEGAAVRHEREPILVVDRTAVATKSGRNALDVAVGRIIELLRKGADMVVVARAGAPVRALPAATWRSEACGILELRWASNVAAVEVPVAA